MIRATLIGGIFFLIPVAFLLLVLGKAWQVSHSVVAPLEGLLPVERVGGVAMLSVLALVLLVLVCLLAGLAARVGPVARQIQRLDALLIDMMPSYAVAKSTLGGVAKQGAPEATLHPVLVRFDDHRALAFEIERNDASAVVFLPGSPSAWSGTSVIVDLDRVERLDLPPHQVTGLLRVMGRGTTEALGRNPTGP